MAEAIARHFAVHAERGEGDERRHRLSATRARPRHAC